METVCATSMPTCDCWCSYEFSLYVLCAVCALCYTLSLGSPSIDQALMSNLQTGQQFVNFSLHDGILLLRTVIVCFRPNDAVDAPGLLYSSLIHAQADTAAPIDTLSLNDVHKIGSGKASKEEWNDTAQEEQCFSLYGTTKTWHLQAPTAQIARLWTSGIHRILIHAGKHIISQVHADLPVLRMHALPLQLQDQILPAQRHICNPNGTINPTDPVDLFHVQAKIGEGSFGKVFVAIDRRDQQQVAIKIIPAKRRLTSNLRKEIHILKHCRSPHIVGYRGAFQRHGHVWIVME